MDFTTLHYQEKPLVIANVWDVPSAMAAQHAGYQALGTSSAAIANMLGYADGEGMSFDELFYIVRRIRAVSSLPLSVDMEAGYADSPEGIVAHLCQLADIGVVGVNLEDSRVIKGVRTLDDPVAFGQCLSAVRSGLSAQGYPLFINVRTDAFLLDLPNALNVTLSRLACYEECGADGLFVPCVSKAQDIVTLIQHTSRPLNVMCVPGLNDFATLGKMGVRRISMGNAVHCAIQGTLNALLLTLHQQQSFSGVFCDENHR